MRKMKEKGKIPAPGMSRGISGAIDLVFHKRTFASDMKSVCGIIGLHIFLNIRQNSQKNPKIETAIGAFFLSLLWEM